MKLNASWLVFAGASVIWGAVISDDLFASAPEPRTELQPRQDPQASQRLRGDAPRADLRCRER
jgi:hypothetical protein